MNGRRAFLKREHIAHLLRAAAGITDKRSFVLVGTGAVIAQLRVVPLPLMQTRELDIQAPPGPEGEVLLDLIDGSIGEGSQFDLTFGYYAHAVPEGTAQLPDDWRLRALEIAVPESDGLTCICPDVNDIALSKLCAWREKDRAWLKAALQAGLLDLTRIVERAARIDNPSAPPADEIISRVSAVVGQSSASMAPPGSRA